jgi:hypothetical protein
LDEFDLDVAPENGPVKMNRLWVVQDGQFAWVYYFGLDGSHTMRRDAREYDPRNRGKFEAATKEALKTIHDQGINTDISFHLDDEVQRILEEKYDIHWFTPQELN